MTLAEKLHELSAVKFKIEEAIDEAFILHHNDIWEQGLKYHIDSDDYDNSLEIYIDSVIPYPWEPCLELRKIIYDMGFSCVYWNFTNEYNDVNLRAKFTEEIRGYEPRRLKSFKTKQEGNLITNAHIHYPGIGYVDDRFNLEEWSKKYKK